MHIGTIIHHKYFNGVVPAAQAAVYQQLVRQHFGHVGMFGSGIMKMVVPDSLDALHFENVDRLIEFSRDSNLALHYNTVITGHLDAFPVWYQKLSPKEKIRALKQHVTSVVGKYSGKVEFFKLVNEATREPDEKYLGTSFDKAELIANIFTWAKEVAPESKFMINEHGPLFRDAIREQFIALIQKIRDRGGPIELVGDQGHLGYFPQPFCLPPDDVLTSSLRRIKDATKLPLYITEFDLSYQNGSNSILPDKPFTAAGKRYESWYHYQGYAYRHLLELCSGAGIEGFYFWMLTDDPTLTWERPGCGLFDEKLRTKQEMKPVYEFMKRNK